MVNFLKQYWWLVLIIVVLVILIVRASNKKKSETASVTTNNPVTGVFNGTVTTVPSPSNVVTKPKTSGFQINDAIYSKQVTNVYKSKSATTGNLDTYHLYGKDEFIGKYLATEGIWTKLNMSSPARVGYVLTNQIYSK